jgi:dihydrolipoamide dehydrogenase
VPASLAVVGTGIIGLELGQALARLGSDVVFFNDDERLGPITDPTVRAVMGAILGEEMTLRLGVTLTDARAVDDGIELVWKADGQSHRQVFAQVLAATGRRPNVDQLDLRAAGLTLDERGVPDFDPRTTRCGESAVFIAGDANNDRPLLHEASDEGKIAGLNAARHAREPRQSPRAHLRRTPLTVVFTDPQIGLVGRTHRELGEQKGGEREWSDRVAVGEVDYRDQGRARVMGQNRGVVRIYGDASDGRLLGAEMAGPAVEHTAHLLAWAIQQRLTVVEALAMPFYHPCLEEGIRTALRDLAARIAMVDPVEVRCFDCGPGS